MVKNQSKILRAMTRDGSARAYVINSTDIVNTAIKYHKTAPTASALLGRTLTATSVMGCMLPENGDVITIAVRGNGIAGTTLCCADYYGNVRGYVANPMADLPVRADGKLDVSGIVGGGILSVMKDVGDEVPYNGNIELVSGEIAEDIAQYFATSEQTPTLCALGVLINPDFSCAGAGGVFVQLLPFPDEAIIPKLEENAKKLSGLSHKFAQGLSNEDILKIALDGIEYDLFDEIDVDYKCDCSRERTGRALMSLGKADVMEIFDEAREKGEKEIVELECHFCDKKYTFTRDEALKLFN